jgi:hypothetical protein
MMAIYFMHYNFVRVDNTLKITPAMAAKVTPNLWEVFFVWPQILFLIVFVIAGSVAAVEARTARAR